MLQNVSSSWFYSSNRILALICSLRKIGYDSLYANLVNLVPRCVQQGFRSHSRCLFTTPHVYILNLNVSTMKYIYV
jgi:hypothetical protein